MNGTAGLNDLDLTSADRATRSQNSSFNTATSQPSTTSATQPLVAKSVGPALANTLEHIVGQLDILTQVTAS